MGSLVRAIVKVGVGHAHGSQDVAHFVVFVRHGGGVAQRAPQQSVAKVAVVAACELWEQKKALGYGC